MCDESMGEGIESEGVKRRGNLLWGSMRADGKCVTREGSASKGKQVHERTLTGPAA